MEPFYKNRKSRDKQKKWEKREKKEKEKNHKKMSQTYKRILIQYAYQPSHVSPKSTIEKIVTIGTFRVRIRAKKVKSKTSNMSDDSPITTLANHKTRNPDDLAYSTGQKRKSSAKER